MVRNNNERLATLETEVRLMTDSYNRMKKENHDEHNQLFDKLDEIKAELPKMMRVIDHTYATKRELYAQVKIISRGIKDDKVKSRDWLKFWIPQIVLLILFIVGIFIK